MPKNNLVKKDAKKTSKKTIIFKFLHFIGYFSSLVLIILIIVSGVQSCSSSNNETVNKPNNNLVISGQRYSLDIDESNNDLFITELFNFYVSNINGSTLDDLIDCHDSTSLRNKFDISSRSNPYCSWVSTHTYDNNWSTTYSNIYCTSTYYYGVPCGYINFYFLNNSNPNYGILIDIEFYFTDNFSNLESQIYCYYVSNSSKYVFDYNSYGLNFYSPSSGLITVLTKDYSSGGYTQSDIDNAYSEGYSEGREFGFSEGLNEGYSLGYEFGYDDGYDVGFSEGIIEGYSEGYNDGYPIGVSEGIEIGYDSGYSEGFTDGFSLGYSEGYNQYEDELQTITLNATFDFRLLISDNIDINTGLIRLNEEWTDTLVKSYYLNGLTFTSANLEYNQIYISLIGVDADTCFSYDVSDPYGVRTGSELFGNDYKHYFILNGVFYRYILNDNILRSTKIYNGVTTFEGKDSNGYIVNGCFNCRNPQFLSSRYRYIDIVSDDEIVQVTPLYNTYTTSQLLSLDGIDIASNTYTTDIFTLLRLGFSSIGGILSIAILPGITLGMLMFLPLVVSVIIIIVKILKK